MDPRRTFRHAQVARRDVRDEKGNIGLDRARRAPGDAAAVGLEPAAVDRTFERDAGIALAGDIRLEGLGQEGIVDEARTGRLEHLPPAKARNRLGESDDLEIGAIGQNHEHVA